MRFRFCPGWSFDDGGGPQGDRHQRADERYPHSELLLYKNLALSDAGMTKEALDHLEDVSSLVCTIHMYFFEVCLTANSDKQSNLITTLLRTYICRAVETWCLAPC